MDRKEPRREDPGRTIAPRNEAADQADRDALARLGRVLSGWELRQDGEASDPRSGVEADLELARAVARGEAGPTFRLWRNPRGLVVTARERRLPRFDEAVHALEGEGWPTVIRDSGGTAIPHDPGFVQLSLVLPRPTGAAGPARGGEPLSLEEVYRALLAPVRMALRGLGVFSEFGTVPGSFCDGRFNLVAAGRKLAGTSQRWRARADDGAPGGYVLAHMTLFAEGDVAGGTRAVNRFQEIAGGDDRFDPEASGTVRALLGASGEGAPPAAGEVSAAVERALARTVEQFPGASVVPR